MQRLWVTVNVQEVLLPGHCGSVWMTGSPQQIVLAVPGCANGDRYRNANGFFLVKRRFTGFCGTAGRPAYGQAGSGLAAAEKTEIDWADRIRSDKRKADLHLTIHFIQWEIEFQSRTSGWRIRMLDCFEFYIFTPDYVLRFSVDYDRNIQDILLRDRAADTKQEMA